MAGTITTNFAATNPSVVTQQVFAGAGQSAGASSAAEVPVDRTTSAKATDLVLSGLPNHSAGSAAASWLLTVLDAENQKSKLMQPSDNAAVVDRLLAMMAR